MENTSDEGFGNGIKELVGDIMAGVFVATTALVALITFVLDRKKTVKEN